MENPQKPIEIPEESGEIHGFHGDPWNFVVDSGSQKDHGSHKDPGGRRYHWCHGPMGCGPMDYGPWTYGLRTMGLCTMGLCTMALVWQYV